MRRFGYLLPQPKPLKQSVTSLGSFAGELAFDQLASSLHRPCTHPHAEGTGDCLSFAARDPSGGSRGGSASEG